MLKRIDEVHYFLQTIEVMKKWNEEFYMRYIDRDYGEDIDDLRNSYYDEDEAEDAK